MKQNNSKLEVSPDNDLWTSLLENGYDRYINNDFDEDDKPVCLPSLHADWIGKEDKSECKNNIEDKAAHRPPPLPPYGTGIARAPEGDKKVGMEGENYDPPLLSTSDGGCSNDKDKFPHTRSI